MRANFEAVGTSDPEFRNGEKWRSSIMTDSCRVSFHKLAFDLGELGSEWYEPSKPDFLLLDVFSFSNLKLGASG